MLFKRHKPDASKTQSAGSTTSATGSNAGVSRSPASGSSESKSANADATGHGAIFSPKPAGQPDRAPTSTAGSSSPSKDSTSMGRAPFPPTSGTPGSSPAGGPTPPSAPLAGGQGAVPGQRPSAVNAPRDDRRTLVVGRGISVQGSVQDAERLVVEGTVESSMINAKELSVAPGGLFRGGVEVEDAEIAGTVDGTLTVRGHLTVAATGRLLGKATCKRLRVEDGGQITGQLEMLSDKEVAIKTDKPA
ncbi:bactofilin family protein [Acetobacter aceti]|uniref:bactofilin family protein n=1 Tax=Acetobacter aceti TaxID=435 RepID=UPI0038D180DA